MGNSNAQIKNNIYTKVLIIGGGAAGMSAALHLNSGDAVILESSGSNSIFSPWNIMIKPGRELREDMLRAGGGKSNRKILDKFIKRNQEILSDLESLGIPLRKSNIGMVPAFKHPGAEIKRIFNEKISKKGTKILNGKANAFLVDKKKSVRGVRAQIKGETTDIYFDYLVLAAGGISSFFNFSTGEKIVNGSVLALCWENGFELENMDLFMFHPFLLADKRLPKMLVSGDILTKMVFKDEFGRKFLSAEIDHALKNNEHHPVFHQMIKEFYAQSLKGKILVEFDCSEEWFEKYKKENEFGHIFLKNKLSDLKDVKIHPAFHFSIGGLRINEKAQTCRKNIYAAGEIASGLHGNNRIGGTAISEAWIFGKIAAEEINKKINNKKIETKNLPLKESGVLGISADVRKMIWDALGPVRNANRLNKFINKIKKISQPTTEEGFISKIAEISLKRKGSAGAFYREDLPMAKTSKNSILINNKIIFR